MTTNQIVLVCEDALHRTFVNQCLKNCGITHPYRFSRQLVASELVAGGNVGDVIEWVNNREFGAWKTRCTRCKTLLIVVADADDFSVFDRMNQLPKSDNALYCVMIPKKNIETWVKLGLVGDKTVSEISENIDYKNSDTRDAQLVKTSVKNLFQRLSTNDMSGQSFVWQTCASALTRLRNGVRELGL